MNCLIDLFSAHLRIICSENIIRAYYLRKIAINLEKLEIFHTGGIFFKCLFPPIYFFMMFNLRHIWHISQKSHVPIFCQ